jgi:hypothetical protein
MTYLSLFEIYDDDQEGILVFIFDSEEGEIDNPSKFSHRKAPNKKRRRWEGHESLMNDYCVPDPIYNNADVM